MGDIEITVVSEIFARCKFRESLDLGLFAFLFSRMASLFSCKHSRELLHYNSRQNGIVETLAFQIFHLGKASLLAELLLGIFHEFRVKFPSRPEQRLWRVGQRTWTLEYKGQRYSLIF